MVISYQKRVVNNYTRSGWLLLVLCLFAGTSFAQMDVELKKYREKWKGEHRIYLDLKNTIDIKINKKGEPEIAFAREETTFYTTDIASRSSRESVSYSEHLPLEKIEAYSLVSDGKKYKKKEVTEFTTKDEFNSGVFHDGEKSTNFFFPQLTTGAKTYLNYVLKVEKPQFVPTAYLVSYIPVERFELTIICDEEVELGFNYINIDESEVPVEISQDKKRKRYTWVLKDIPKYQYESDAPGSGYYLPHIIPRIKYYTFNGERHNVLESLSDLHGWYQGLIKDVNQEASEEIKNTVDSLIRGKTTELEKVEAIYYWVQDNIKYIAFEAGMAGFIPEEASSVCKKKFGDCKGMSSILTTMLTEAGIPSSLTWIGTRQLPYDYTDVPTPMVDNHMIAAYKGEDRYYFLDATGGSSPLEYGTAFIQGKQALINAGEGRYEVERVPVCPPEASMFEDTTRLKLGDDNLLFGNSNARLTGFLAVPMRNLLKSLNEEDTKRALDGYFEKGSNRFALDTASFQFLADRNKDLLFDYEFTLGDYAKSNEDELYVNLNLEKVYADGDIKSDRKIPWDLRFKSLNLLTVEMEIPDGYEVTYLPGNEAFEKEDFGYSQTYEVKDNKVIRHFRHYDNFLLMEEDRFSDWNKMIKSMKKAYKEVVIFKRKVE